VNNILVCACDIDWRSTDVEILRGCLPPMTACLGDWQSAAFQVAHLCGAASHLVVQLSVRFWRVVKVFAFAVVSLEYIILAEEYQSWGFGFEH
jgi:hypothetical protein